METLYSEDEYKRAQKRVKELKGFYWHLAIFIIINAYILVNAYISGGYKGESFWHWTTFTTLFSWGGGLIIHAWFALWKDYFFTKKWEEEQIRKIMEKEAREEKSHEFKK